MREYVDNYEDRLQHYPYSLPDKALKFDSVEDLRRKVTRSGSHFFSPGAMRFFSSRVSGELFGGRFFVTSESDGDNPRRYTVRYVYDYEGDLSTQDLGFQRFATLSGAKALADRAATILQ